jgi:type I restriction enzyme S subunit
LNEVAEIYDGPHATPKKTEAGPWFLSISSLRDGRLALEESAHLSEEDYVHWTRRVAPCSGDVLFSYETRLGDAALMPDGLRACLGRRMGLLRPVRAEVHPRFLLYSYLAPAFQAEIEKRAVRGATVDRIPLNELGEWPIVIPPLLEQRAIAEVLGALDDKIEANQSLCSIVGGLARAEVVAGQALAEHAVPLGNLVRRVTDIARPDELDAGIVYVGLEHIPRGSLFLTEWGSSDELASAKARFQPGDILFGKLRPYFKKVVIAPSAGVCSTDVLVLRPRQPEQSALALIVCSSDEVINYASAGSHGTRMPRVSWDYLSAWQCPVPSEGVIQTIQHRVEPMLQQALHLTHESVLLAQIRDALLPKLLSGELRVRDAETLVEEAV